MGCKTSHAPSAMPKLTHQGSREARCSKSSASELFLLLANFKPLLNRDQLRPGSLPHHLGHHTHRRTTAMAAVAHRP